MSPGYKLGLLYRMARYPHKKLKFKKICTIAFFCNFSYTNFKSSASSREAGDEASNSETSELDTFGTIPSWIKQELAEAGSEMDINESDAEMTEKRSKGSRRYIIDCKMEPALCLGAQNFMGIEITGTIVLLILICMGCLPEC